MERILWHVSHDDRVMDLPDLQLSFPHYTWPATCVYACSKEQLYMYMN